MQRLERHKKWVVEEVCLASIGEMSMLSFSGKLATTFAGVNV